MNARRKIFATLAMLALCLPLAACGEGQIRQSALAAHRIELGVTEARLTKDDLLAKGQIDAAESKQIAQFLFEVNELAGEFNALIKPYAEADALPPEVVPKVLELFEKLSQAVGRLNDKGVLHLKNPKARAAVAAAVLGINTSLALIRGAVNRGPK